MNKILNHLKKKGLQISCEMIRKVKYNHKMFFNKLYFIVKKLKA